MNPKRIGGLCLAAMVVCAVASAQDIQQSRGIDARVDYASLARFGPWDDRNYALSAEDLTWLAANEEDLHPGIPLFYRIELRKQNPGMMTTGPAQYPRAARQFFRKHYGGYFRDGVYEEQERRGQASRTAIAIDGEIKLSDVLGADEITVEINHVDPSKVIAGSNNSGGTFGQKMYYSADGGATWNIASEGVANGVLDDTCCDPTVGWSSNGLIAYAATLGDGVSPSFTTVGFYRSTDFGASWGTANNLTPTNTFDDKEFLHVDISATSAHKDNVYLTWHTDNVLQFARSTDLGLNFTIKAFTGLGGQLVSAPVGIGSDITTDSAGNIYYAYAAFNDQTLVLLKSTDGGVSFAAPVTIDTTNGSFVFPIPAMETRLAWIYAAIDADRSGGPFDGNVYCAWTDVTGPTNGTPSLNHTQIIVARSSNGGATWQTSIPHPTADVNTIDRFNQWLTVDENGIVHVVYYDTQNSVSRTGVDFYYTNSDDGAVTWETPTRISTVTSVNMTNGQEWGDYNGISVVNGNIITTWTDNRPPTAASASDVYTGLMTLQPNRAEIWVDFGHTGSELGTQSSPYNTLTEGIAAVDTSGVVKITKVSGTSTSTETLTVVNAMTLEAVSGAVQVGVVARALGASSEFNGLLDRLREDYGLAATESEFVSQSDGGGEAHVLPFSVDSDDAVPASERVMALRLRNERSTDAQSLWAAAGEEAIRANFPDSAVVAGDSQDVWVLFQSEETEMLQSFLDLAVAEQEDRTVDLQGGVGEVYNLSGRNFERPMRVWLPLPQDLPSNLLKPFFYVAAGPDWGWRAAEDIEGWLVDGSEVRMTVDGTTYLGFLIRFGGIVQLGIAE